MHSVFSFFPSEERLSHEKKKKKKNTVTRQNLDARLQGQDPAAPGLTEHGRVQAAALGDELVRRWKKKRRSEASHSPPPPIFSSDLARAAETAALVAAAFGVSNTEAVTLDPAFRERHLGVLQGVRRADGPATHPGAWQALGSGEPVPGGGEGCRGVRARVASGLGRAAAAAGAGGVAVVISHGGAMAQAHW
jgi:broad specificity phosphatase PhoE